MRSGLESYVLLVRNWKAYSDLSPPKALRKLLERLFCGEGIYLAMPTNNKLPLQIVAWQR